MNNEIQDKISKSDFYKFGGIAPEGFILITEDALEKLKDFDFWKEWKNDPSILTDYMKENS